MQAVRKAVMMNRKTSEKQEKMLDKLKILWYHVRVAQRKAGNEQNQITSQKFEKPEKSSWQTESNVINWTSSAWWTIHLNRECKTVKITSKKFEKERKKFLTNEIRCDKINELKPPGFNDCTL